MKKWKVIREYVDEQLVEAETEDDAINFALENKEMFTGDGGTYAEEISDDEWHEARLEDDDEEDEE
jgi:hypothetical protein